MSFRLDAKRRRNPCLIIEAIGKFYLGEILRHGSRVASPRRDDDLIYNSTL